MSGPEKLSDVTENSKLQKAKRVVIDGLSVSQRELENATYSDTDVVKVEMKSVGNGTLVLSPKSGDPDITYSNAELVAMGINVYNKEWFGRYDAVTTTGTTIAHIYHD